MSAAAVLLGTGSLLLFMVFLFTGSSPLARSGGGGSGALWWDAGLSLAFFAQHSGFMRRGFRSWSMRLVPDHLAGAFYAITSGVVLTALLALWRPAEPLWTAPPGAIRWSFRAAYALALLVFLWGGLSLGRSFDPCGLAPVRRWLKGKGPGPLTFSARGPYRWVRHPLYSSMMLAIWSCPDVTADRLLLDVLFTCWIVVGAVLEERDLVAQFGGEYLDYQRQVPMFVPWKGAYLAAAAGAAPRGR